MDEYLHIFPAIHCLTTGNASNKPISIINRKIPINEHIAPDFIITPEFKIPPTMGFLADSQKGSKLLDV